MATKVRSLEIYEELAGLYDRQGQAKLRDWFLVLAADVALARGQEDDAERLRRRLLHVNPHHLLRPYESFAEALDSSDVAKYVADLRKHYPLETAEQLLRSAKKKPVVTAATVEPRQEEGELKVYRAKVKVDMAAPAQEPKRLPLTPSLPLPVIGERSKLNGTANLITPAPIKVPEPVEQATSIDYWVATVLFILMLLVGAGVGFYAFVSPFLSN
ncbi:MAG TPA: hypothetical protein VE988_21620 [Gemmataceae bacterium]|nr:hypothetical protein [Gemmataceae bacterium]